MQPCTLCTTGGAGFFTVYNRRGWVLLPVYSRRLSFHCVQQEVGFAVTLANGPNLTLLLGTGVQTAFNMEE